MKFFNPIAFFVLFLSQTNCRSQTEGTIRAKDGAPIYFRSYGSGKPLLILNGGPGMNSNGFEALAKKLGEHNLAIIYDQRGTGKSVLKSLDSSTITMNRMMDDIECLRKHFHFQKWALLGHSFGGILASYYATLYPEHVDRIVFSSSGGIDLDLLTYVSQSINSKLSKAELDSMNYWSAKIDAGDTSHYARLQRGKALAPAYLVDRKFIPVLAERLTQGNGAINQLIWSDLQKISYDCAEKLKTFDRPVLIIQGKQDIIKAETAEKAHRVLKHSRVVLMDHCGHYGWLDNEQVYFQEVNSFLADPASKL